MPLLKNSTRPCPVCCGTRASTLFRQSFEQLSSARLLDGYDVVICEECGAGYASSIPDQAAFDGYYRDLSKYDHADRGSTEPPGDEQRFRDIAGVLEEFVPARDARILEIGSGSGQLLKILKDDGFPHVTASDPAAGCVRAAQELYGVPGVVGTVFTVPQPEKPYDFLILIGVMEHICDLDRTVERFHQLLHEGGRVYLEVPDASRYVARLDAPFQEFSVEHINYFSPRSLCNLMNTRGFRTLTTGQVVRPQHEVTCPCTYAVFEKVSGSVVIERDTETERGLRSYIEGCRTEDERIRLAIQKSIAPGEQMIVWGVGAHTLRLLATGGLEPSRIALFVDSNPKYQNQKLRGVPVVPPQELKQRSEAILISSRGFQQEIHDQIRGSLGLQNPLIMLYGA